MLLLLASLLHVLCCAHHVPADGIPSVHAVLFCPFVTQDASTKNIYVESVVPDGNAAKNGVSVGDQLIATSGVVVGALPQTCMSGAGRSGCLTFDHSALAAFESCLHWLLMTDLTHWVPS
jgi:hypothetical protein